MRLMPQWNIITMPDPSEDVQRRSHRRRRINKKWLKRYGLKTVFKDYDRSSVFVNEAMMTIYCHAAQVNRVRQLISQV